MNKITILAATACLSLAITPLYADDAHHPEKAQASSGAKPTARMATTARPAGEKVKQVQQTMQKLQDKMAQIRGTKDPMVRQRLMHEHMQTMQEGMMQMRGMGGGMMMGMGGDQGGMMMGGGMMQNMMSMRMDMMQMMMEQMMQREAVREGTAGK
jgi:hypothetical protein